MKLKSEILFILAELDPNKWVTCEELSDLLMRNKTDIRSCIFKLRKAENLVESRIINRPGFNNMRGHQEHRLNNNGWKIYGKPNIAEARLKPFLQQTTIGGFPNHNLFTY